MERLPTTSTNADKQLLKTLLKPFESFPRLTAHIEKVILSLPEDIHQDLVGDASFSIALDDCEPGRGRTVLVPIPGTHGASRSVVLKPRLENCSESFTCYIIAHEFAHAYLRNGGWGEITCREEAADALAATWGYSKVPRE